MVTGSCVLRETAQTGCPWSRPRLSLSWTYLSISPPPDQTWQAPPCRGRTCAAKSTPTNPDPRRLFRSLPFAHLSPCEPLDTPISRQASTCLVVQTVPCHATQYRMNEQDVAEMRALLDAAGVRRCAFLEDPPPTQCGAGAAACGCGFTLASVRLASDPACFFTLQALEEKVRSSGPYCCDFAPVLCSCARRRCGSSLEKTARSRLRVLSQLSGWMASSYAPRASLGKPVHRTGPWSALRSSTSLRTRNARVDGSIFRILLQGKTSQV